MTAYAMKPNFIDREEYLIWMRSWKAMYARLSESILQRKRQVKSYQRLWDKWHQMNRSGDKSDFALQYNINQLADLQRELIHFSSVATKMLTLRQEALLRRDRILEMHREVYSQPFPLEISECDRVDFHFNKISLEFPWMPNWTLKTKGRTYYIRDLISEIGFSTRNREHGQTKGEIRFRKVSLTIDRDGVAKVS